MKKIMLQTILFCCLCVASCSGQRKKRADTATGSGAGRTRHARPSAGLCGADKQDLSRTGLLRAGGGTSGAKWCVSTTRHAIMPKVLEQLARIRHTSICLTATTSTPTDAITCFTSYTDTTVRRQRHSRRKTVCYANCSTT